MKTIRTFLLFLVIFTSNLPVFAQINDSNASRDAVNRLISMQAPGSPVIVGNSVIFTIDSGYRRVGVAFAHEDFASVRWFTKLLVPQDRRSPVLLPGQTVPDSHMDSGIQFYIYEVPEHLNEIKYRLIINGLWTTDPLNPQTERDPLSGLNYSVLRLPERSINLSPERGLPDGLIFTFRPEGEFTTGEIVTLAGSFNAWDPFMLELREGPPGTYTITLPLPPGTYQYVFIHRGRRYTDPNNRRRAYASDGSSVSVIEVP